MYLETRKKKSSFAFANPYDVKLTEGSSRLFITNFQHQHCFARFLTDNDVFQATWGKIHDVPQFLVAHVDTVY